MTNTVLETLEEFAIGTVMYRRGTKIPLADTSQWPAGSLERRLNNGFVRYAVIEEEKPKTVKSVNKVVLKDAE